MTGATRPPLEVEPTASLATARDAEGARLT